MIVYHYFCQLPVNILRSIINFINSYCPCDGQILKAWDSQVRMGEILSIRGDISVSQIAILSEAVAFCT